VWTDRQRLRPPLLVLVVHPRPEHPVDEVHAVRPGRHAQRSEDVRVQRSLRLLGQCIQGRRHLLLGLHLGADVERLPNPLEDEEGIEPPAREERRQAPEVRLPDGQKLGITQARLRVGVHLTASATRHSRMPPEHSGWSCTSMRKPSVATGVKVTRLKRSRSVPQPDAPATGFQAFPSR